MHSLYGITLKLASVLMFISMASLIKYLSDTFPAGQSVFFRAFFAFPVILGWLVMTGRLRSGLRVNSVYAHAKRGMIGTAAMGLGFFGLAYLPLPEATTLSYASPILIVIFSAWLLGETIRLFRISAVILGLIGVLIVMAPRFSVGVSVDVMQTVGAVAVLASATLAALVQIHIRQMVQTEETSAIVFYFTLTATVLSLFTLPFGWTLPTLPQLGLFICAGLLGGFGQIFLTASYKYAPASLVGIFDYFSIIFSIVIGYYVFSEVPSRQILIGAGLIMASGLAIIFRETQLGLRRGKARAIKPTIDQ